MKHLIKLELERFPLKPHLLGVILANIIILALSVSVSSIFATTSMQSIPSGLPPLQLSTIAIAKLLIKTTLIVWQSVLIATIIVEEYQSKTIMLLYTYPINRKKMIVAKITLVCGIMLAFYLSSEVFQHIAIYIFSRYISFITYQLDNILIQLVIIISAILLGLVPLYIGMIRKSTIATIVSSLIIVCITSNSQGSTAGLISVPAVAITFGVIGLIFTVLAIKKIITSDLY
ncbi:ABC transporter permease [Clostridium botulinum]|uniref:Bacitracin ABC transporter permease n=1 Tax=Clostridium botulinum TaxID=1491 RepID=A0A6G4EIN7_CLOBO|nr:ABC transporter permease [Clostridium botulinum]APH19315.1 putative membrane protein [Clostridium botulinum]AUM90948.1 bacitracin ABC transporter permease [Clostridium botulinum]KEI78230.1 bacitracin transport permease BCRB [Clostridium botulinum A2 117]MBN3415428.1 bacitracin ABC transporter permease [Clostridium botulinum]MBN3441721.1 bacitracin ABC transporter permease [Clostridium botulinum]